jgi:ATPase subunit of ABC transporter with duplicated ATPase domains
VVAITHDRYFLDNVAKWILELDRGRGVPYEGNYSGWLEQKRDRLAQEEKAQSARQRTLERELEWVRMSPRARQSKSKARLQAYEQLASEAQQEKVAQNEIVIPPAPRLGNDGGGRRATCARASATGCSSTGCRSRCRAPGSSASSGRTARGRPPFFKMVAGQETPDEGQVKLGETVVLGYVDQNRTLTSGNTVWQEISGGRETVEVGKREMNTRAYLSSFNFKGTDQQKKVGDLSGGERNRLHLAKTLMTGSNLLMLDEPTNDLDVDTLRALEQALLDFSGCAVVISHDRWFLDRVATHILAFEGNSEVVWHEGNYQSYIEDLKRRKGADADQPHRVQYKKLVRA